MSPSKKKDSVERISISLPKTLLAQLDSMIGQRGFDSRSRAIAEMINAQLAEHGEIQGTQIMAGTITLIYDHSKANLQSQLSDIQHRHIAEVISSLHVHLERHHTMEVILVQGTANKLKAIANELITCKGVKTGKLQLSTAVMPPLAR
jgi:CopG family transcriptional regulator, nickel-responsive regulator